MTRGEETRKGGAHASGSSLQLNQPELSVLLRYSWHWVPVSLPPGAFTAIHHVTVSCRCGWWPPLNGWGTADRLPLELCTGTASRRQMGFKVASQAKGYLASVLH